MALAHAADPFVIHYDDGVICERAMNKIEINCFQTQLVYIVII